MTLSVEISQYIKTDDRNAIPNKEHIYYNENQGTFVGS